MTHSVSLGRLLKENRERKILALLDVATQVGVSIQFICDVESGRRPFPATKLKEWSSALGILPDVIVGYLLSEGIDRLERHSGYQIQYKIVPTQVVERRV